MELPELPTLDLDLTEAVRPNLSFAFRVRIKPTPLALLAVQARSAHRVYELILISRPGDLLDYLVVEAQDLPERIAQRVNDSRQQLSTDRLAEAVGIGDPVPIRTFDTFFCDFADDREPADDAWFAVRESHGFKRYLRGLLLQVRKIQRGLTACGPLLQYELARIRRVRHPYIFLDRASALANGRRGAPAVDAYSESFYQKLAELIAEPSLSKISYRGEGDHRMFRMLCAEQLRRATLGRSSTVQRSLEIHALTDAYVNVEPWGARIEFHEEGIGRPELFIDDGTCGRSLKDSVEGPGSISFVSTHTIISTVDAGELRNCTRQTGDGWTLYFHSSSWKRLG